MSLFDEEPQGTTPGPAASKRRVPLKPAPRSVKAAPDPVPTQPPSTLQAPSATVEQPTDDSPEYVFDSVAAAKARKARAAEAVGLSSEVSQDPQSSGPRYQQVAQAAHLRRQEDLERITVQKLLRERTTDALDPELVRRDQEVGQFRSASYVRRLHELQRRLGDPMATRSEEEDEYYNQLNQQTPLPTKPKPDASSPPTAEEHPAEAEVEVAIAAAATAAAGGTAIPQPSLESLQKESQGASAQAVGRRYDLLSDAVEKRRAARRITRQSVRLAPAFLEAQLQVYNAAATSSLAAVRALARTTRTVSSQ